MLKSSGITLSLAVLAIVGALGIDAYLPSLQAIGQSLQTDPATVQQTLSIYIAMMALTTLFAGTLSDSFGRRPTVMASLLLFAGASVLAIFAKSISVLMLARGLQGIAAGFSVVLSRAIVQDRFQGPEAQRVMSLITMVFSIAPSVAPIIGGWLQASLGWQSVFVMLSLYGFGLWALWAWGVPETLPAERRGPFRMGRLQKQLPSPAAAHQARRQGRHPDGKPANRQRYLRQPEQAGRRQQQFQVGQAVAPMAGRHRLQHQIERIGEFGNRFANRGVHQSHRHRAAV